jgi:hypothetical protein
MTDLSIPPAAKPPFMSRDKVHGLAVVGAAFLLSMVISLWAKRVSEPERGEPPAPPSTIGVSGWPHQVDALATLKAARDLTRRTRLRGLVMEGVKSDGSIDPAHTGKVRYVFQSPPRHGPQPPRVPGLVPPRNLCGRQEIRVEQPGIYALPDQPSVPCPPTAVEALPEPRSCSPKQVWAHALTKGVAGDRTARIEYYHSAVGPAWRFELDEGSVRFSLYGNCQRELTSREAVGSVP